MESKYQPMPPLSEEEYAALKEDIRENGVQVAVVEDESGNVLDGHHRRRAWEELTSLGFTLPDYPRNVRAGLSEQEKRDVALRLNLQRRHLSNEQRRAVIGEAIKQAPERSHRWIAELVGCDRKTVASVRRDLESRGEIPHLDRIVGKDGKGYVRTRYGSYESEENREIKRRETEIHYGVRDAIRETPDTPDADIAEEFGVSVDYVEDNRRQLEDGPTIADLYPSDKRASIHMSETAKEKRDTLRERRRKTKAARDEGKLKVAGAQRSMRLIRDLDRSLQLRHKNENRRITPQEAAGLYIEDQKPLGSVFKGMIQEDLEAVARVAGWIEEFAPELAREIDQECGE